MCTRRRRAPVIPRVIAVTLPTKRAKSRVWVGEPCAARAALLCAAAWMLHDAEHGAAMGADEVADGDEAAAAAVNATLTLAATAPGTAPDVVLASRAALSATYRAIRHEGQIEPDRARSSQIEPDRRRLMTPDGS